MKKIFKEICEKADLVGTSSIIYNKGRIVEKLNNGYSSKEKKKKVSNNTVFRIASVSKVIVALCLMNLYEKGLVDLDEDISKYLGFLVRNPKYMDDSITLRMILTQTSSISDGQEKDVNSDVDTGYNRINGTNEECSLEDLISINGSKFVSDTFNNYKPGTHFEYSNLGCGVIACIIEKVTGEYFTDYVKTTVFKPLKLDASFIVTDIKNKDIASTYYKSNGKIILSRDKEGFSNRIYKKFPLGDNFRGPAGGCFISTNDLMKLMITLLNGGEPIIKRDTLDEMMQMNWCSKKVKNDSYVAKGLQLEILDHFHGKRLYGHFGDAYGVKSFFLFNPKQQFGMVYITNGGGYKYQESGICDVHEKILDASLNKYWIQDVNTFYYLIKSGYGYLGKRKIKVASHITKNGIYFSDLALFDALGINVLEHYDYIKENCKKHTIDTILNHFKEKYNYEFIKNEDSYLISYKY